MDKEQLIKDFRNLHTGRSYPKRGDKLRLIEERFRAADAFIREIGKEESLPEFGYTGAVLQRRKEALLYYLEHTTSDGDLISFEESMVKFEAMPMSATYHWLDFNANLYCAAALYVLDDLRRNNRLVDAVALLPKDYDFIWDADFPSNFYDPSYDEELVRCIASALRTRNKKPGDRWEADTFTDKFTVTGNRPDTEYRRIFDGLMDLMSDEAKEEAASSYKAGVDSILSIYLSCIAFYDHRDKESATRLGHGNNVLLARPVTEEEEDRIIDEVMRDFLEDESGRDAVFRRFDILVGKPVDEIMETVSDKRIARRMSRFTVEDPYKVCFGLLHLLETGDHAPWMFKCGYSVLRNAGEMLPWEDSPFDTIPEGADEDEWWEPEITYNYNGWAGRDTADPSDLREVYAGRNVAQMVYGLSGAVLPRVHPFAKEKEAYLERGMDPVVVERVIASAEALFLSQFQCEATNLHGGNWWEREEQQSSTEEEQPSTDGEPEKPEKPEETREPELERQLRRLKDENKGLRKSLAEGARNAAKEKTALERELTELRREHRELADLRELVFNQSALDTEEPTEDEIAYPYTTQKRVVVFGGHETWLKAFKPKFTNVKFVDASQYSFAPELITNADVIWIQNNRISHSQYYAIVNTARKHGIQVRYFPYSSADKCAAVLVKEDLE